MTVCLCVFPQARIAFVGIVLLNLAGLVLFRFMPVSSTRGISVVFMYKSCLVIITDYKFHSIIDT